MRSRPDLLQSRDSFTSTPTMLQVPFSPCSVNSTRRSPSLQTRSPQATGQFAPSAWPAVAFAEAAAPLQSSRPFAFSAARPAGRSSHSRARHRSGWRGLAVAVVGPLAHRGSASPGSLRAHPSRHGEDAVSCRLLCASFTGCGRNMPASAGKEVGRLRTCFVFHLVRS